MVSAAAMPISRPPNKRADQAADAADDDGDEARHQQIVAHVGIEADLPGGEHAAQAGQQAAEGEVEGAQVADVDAERRHGLEIERSGADAQADAGIAQEGEQPDHGDDDDRHHEDAVPGDEKQLAVIGCDKTAGSPIGSPFGPQMYRAASCITNASPKVNSRL